MLGILPNPIGAGFSVNRAVCKLYKVTEFFNSVAILMNAFPQAVHGCRALACMVYHWCNWSEASSYLNAENCPPNINPVQYHLVKKIVETVFRDYSIEDIGSVEYSGQEIKGKTENQLKTSLYNQISNLKSDFTINVKVTPKEKTDQFNSYEFHRSTAFGFFVSSWTSHLMGPDKKKN